MSVYTNPVDHVLLEIIEAKTRLMLDRELFQSVVLIHDPNEDIHDLIGCFALVHRHIFYHLLYKVKCNFGAKEAASRNPWPKWNWQACRDSSGTWPIWRRR
ncbi:MAG: hypothetical protein ACLP51_09285, partial [Syntrophobacteraceae bacterium]